MNKPLPIATPSLVNAAAWNPSLVAVYACIDRGPERAFLRGLRVAEACQGAIVVRSRGRVVGVGTPLHPMDRERAIDASIPSKWLGPAGDGRSAPAERRSPAASARGAAVNVVARELPGEFGVVSLTDQHWAKADSS